MKSVPSVDADTPKILMYWLTIRGMPLMNSSPAKYLDPNALERHNNVLHEFSA